MTRSLFAAALAATFLSHAHAAGPAEPAGMAHALLPPPQGAPIAMLYPAVPGLRYRFLSAQTGREVTATLAVARIGAAEYLHTLTLSLPGQGLVEVRTRQAGGDGLRLEAVHLPHHPQDLADDPLYLSAGTTVYARQVFHAEPAQPHPITGSPQSWDLQVVGFEDLTLGGHRYRGCVRYRLRVQDTLSGARTGDAVIVLAPGIGPVQVRGYLMGVGVDLRLREVLWPWAGEASS